MGLPSLLGTACCVAVCLNSPFQNNWSIVGVSAEDVLQLALVCLYEEGMGLVLPPSACTPDDEMCCLLAGGSLTTDSSSSLSSPTSRSISGLRRFWRSLRCCSNCARSDRKVDEGCIGGTLKPGPEGTFLFRLCNPSALEASRARWSSAWNSASSSSASSSKPLGLVESWRLSAIALSKLFCWTRGNFWQWLE